MNNHIDWLTYPHNVEKGTVGLEGIFEAAYGKPMEMLVSTNGETSSHAVTKAKMSQSHVDAIAKGVSSGHFESYSLGMYLNDLCSKDVIPPGSYCVSMSW